MKKKYRKTNLDGSKGKGNKRFTWRVDRSRIGWNRYFKICERKWFRRVNNRGWALRC